ncbi:hypothetical protein LUZ61_008189 [Rhynchospora tenuis]|uniref:F-box domain-containing protein n=1 Tax=Rhynchospora tenuis TaxID=198213 RepID=A0AAD6EX95_9POAL|nr:hypothetical protein LUZ61_008189 [Rhynchospora tenuis]
MRKDEEPNKQLQAELRGDVLEKVVMHVPMADLPSVSFVSREWHRAVHSSLLYRPSQLPWLIMRDQRSPKSSSLYIHALDPYSRSWISFSLSNKPFEMVMPCILRRSGGDRFYALLFRKMAISRDPFGAKWEEAKALRTWKADPVVAEVGPYVVVAGGGSLMELDYGQEGSVELYDRRTSMWEPAGLIPVMFEGSTCATWLSVVASHKRLYIMERKTGWISWFDPEIKRWGPVRQLRPDPALSAWAITVGNEEKLLLFGVGREGEGEHGGKMKVRTWQVKGDNLLVVDNKAEEMPKEMVDRLFPCDKGDDATWQDCSLEVCGTEHGGYVCNPVEMRNGVVGFELSSQGKKNSKRIIVERWEWVPSPERVGHNPMGRILCGSSPVGFHDICGLRRC